MDFSITHSNGLRLPHFSASTVNSWITNKPEFYEQKVKGERFQGNPNMFRGTAVEHGVNEWLENGNEDAANTALDKFDALLIEAGISKFTVEDIRDSVPGLAVLALSTFKNQWGDRKPLTQQKISCKLPGVNREIIGYLDFLTPSIMVEDCKVSSKSPSALSQNYIIQGAFYKFATGLPVSFQYFIPNKVPVTKRITLTDDQYLFGLSYLTEACKIMEELEECDDPKRVMQIMSFPDLSACWNADDKRKMAKIWGIKFL